MQRTRTVKAAEALDNCERASAHRTRRRRRLCYAPDDDDDDNAAVCVAASTSTTSATLKCTLACSKRCQRRRQRCCQRQLKAPPQPQTPLESPPYINKSIRLARLASGDCSATAAATRPSACPFVRHRLVRKSHCPCVRACVARTAP